MIELNQVTKKFRQKKVLEQISLQLENGVYGLLGPNGAGKTTLLRCLLGLYPLNGGEIKMDIPYHKVGYLPQTFGLFRELTVYDMLYYFCGLKKIPKNKRQESIEEALEYVNLLESKKTQISKLSGGMQRRVGIAQAVLGNPPLIIFDEPTVGLDPEERKRFKDMLFQIKENKTILFSTHIVGDIEDVCDQIIIMKNGKVLKAETLHEMCESDGISTDLEKVYLTIMAESRGQSR